MSNLYDPELERAWCSPTQNDTVREFRRQANEKRLHPLSGHHFVPLISENDRLLGSVCWYCGRDGH